MKKLSRITAILLVLATLIALVGCGHEINEIRHKDNKDELVAPAASLNGEALYDSVTYGPEMFMGRYYLKEAPKNMEDLGDLTGWMNSAIGSYNDEPQDLTAIPHYLRIGPNTCSHKIFRHNEYMWGEISFYNGNHNLVTWTVAVEVENNDTLCFTPVLDFTYDEETDTSSYTLADTCLDYKFDFQGFDLTLTSQEGKSLALRTDELTDYFEEYNKAHQICVDSYASLQSPRIDGNIEAFSFLSNDKKPKVNRFYVKVTDPEEDGYNTCKAVGYLGEDGLFTFSYTDQNGTVHSYQYLYFYLQNDGIILYDGQTTYYYTNAYDSALDAIVSEEDAAIVSELSETRVEEIIETKNSLFDALSAAFAAANIAAGVDPVTGEIAIDSAVLFDVNKSDISEEGQAFLTAFWDVYTGVLSAEEYTGFLAAILVEGHADPSGNYEDNMILSEARAQSVLDFCQGLGGSSTPMEAIGYSSDKPILDASGEVDYDASRRVAFRFRVNV